MHVYHDEIQAKKVKPNIHRMGSFPSIPLSIFQGSYDVLIGQTETIEKIM